MPSKIKIGIVSLKPDSKDSGNKSRNAAPNKVPAAKLTRKNKALFNTLSFKKMKMPNKDTKLTAKTAIKIWNSVESILFRIFQ